jgi:tetratricopeptide (TPR) repeat protein
LIARFLQVVRRRWLLLALVGLLALGGTLAFPHGYAWYHLRAGRDALQRYQTAKARDHLEKCLRVWPTNAEAHLLASRASRRAEAFAQADEHLRVCQRLEGGPTEDSVLEWALLRATMGDLEEVERYLVQWAEKHPGQADLVWEALVSGYLRVYRVLDALTYLDLWLTDEPENLRAHFLRGNLHRQVGAFAQAADDYRKVLDLDPNQDQARHLLAFCLEKIGRYQEALTQLERLLQTEQDRPDRQVLLARCYHYQGNREKAQHILEEVLTSHPDYGPALAERGRQALLAEKATEAEHWLRQAVRALPYDYTTNWHLYQALREQAATHPQKAEEARKQLARSETLKDRIARVGEISSREMSRRPNDPALHCELGILLIQTGHPQVGQRWLLSALELDPGNQKAHAALAEFYRKAGNPTQAAYHQQQAQSKE